MRLTVQNCMLTALQAGPAGHLVKEAKRSGAPHEVGHRLHAVVLVPLRNVPSHCLRARHPTQSCIHATHCVNVRLTGNLPLAECCCSRAGQQCLRCASLDLKVLRCGTHLDQANVTVLQGGAAPHSVRQRLRQKGAHAQRQHRVYETVEELHVPDACNGTTAPSARDFECNGGTASVAENFDLTATPI
jgi:hypothetical protein